jgi:hypothetical protein
LEKRIKNFQCLEKTIKLTATEEAFMDKHIVVGVHITERVKHAGEVQKVFTEFGCQIRTRLGLHEADKGVCSPNGMILLDMVDDDAKVGAFKKKLLAIDGIEVQSMIFDHA